MTVLTKAEVNERRKYFMTNATKTTIVAKGTKRVGGTRICAVCQTQLSKVILSNGSTYALREHYHFKMSSIFTVNMCKDSKICQKEHERRRQLEC